MVRITRWIMNHVLRLGARTAVDTALGAAVDVVPRATNQSYTQVFNVALPVTVYVRATNCRVSLRRAVAPKVILQANMYRAFGFELVAEQDNAGVYIVGRQKPVVGKLSKGDFTITVPDESHVVFHLTPGEIVLQDVDGMLDLPPVQAHQKESS